MPKDEEYRNLLETSSNESRILYSLVARRQIVLAETNLSSGNFASVARVLISKVDFHKNETKSYQHQKYFFHYIVEDEFLFLCISDKKFRTLVAFQYLSTIKDKFKANFSQSIAAELETVAPLKLNDTFGPVLRSHLNLFNDNKQESSDILGKVKSQVEDVRSIVVENIEKVLQRGEKIEVLVDKTSEMQNTAMKFESSARTLRKSLWWKNVRGYAIMALVAILTLYFLVASFCGANFSLCTK